MKRSDKTPRNSLGAALLILLFASLPALGSEASADLADLPLDALLDMPVTGASRFVQRRSQAASAVTVVTREEIRAFGYRTLSDVLRGVRGVSVATDRTYDYLGVRGFLASGDYNTRVLLLIDGNRINDGLYDQAFIGSEFPLDLDAVERIEFVPGQGSAVYGANALFGVINVITRESSRHRGGTASVALGRAGERTLKVSLNAPLQGGGLQLMASRRVSAGAAYFDATQAASGANDGWSRGTDGEQRSAAYLRWDQGGLALSVLHAERLKGTPATIGLIYADPRNTYLDAYSQINLEHVWPLDAQTDVTARAYVGRYHFVGNYMMDYPPPTLNRDLGDAHWQGLEARVTSTRLTGQRLVGGMDLQVSDHLAQGNFDVEPAGTVYLDDRRHGQRVAAYLDDQITLSPAWTVHLGARVDRVPALPIQFSPRLGLIHQPSQAWTFKAIHGRAFRPPNAYEAHYAVDTPAGYVANPALGSERVRGNELIAEWRPLAGWQLSGSLYRSHATQMLLVDYNAATDRYQFGNAGAQDLRGAELELEHARGAARYRINFSWSQPSPSHDAITDSVFPKQMLKGSALLPLPRDWKLGLAFQAQSRRGAAPGAAQVNLALHGQESWTGADLSLGVNNLFDRSLFDPGADPQRQPVVTLPGRRWRIEATWPLGF
jgi:iron complex outermembrane receptor protein